MNFMVENKMLDCVIIHVRYTKLLNGHEVVLYMYV